MRGGLFWKLLLGFWLVFFVIAQLVWVLVIVESPVTAQDDQAAQREAPAIFEALGTALHQGGIFGALNVRDSLPLGLRNRLEIIPPSSASSPHIKADAFLEHTATAPDGTVFRLRYHYEGTRRFQLAVPIEPIVLAIALGPFFGLFMTWYLIAPIRRLRQGFERLASGDLTTRLAPDMGDRKDELADLAREFDAMAVQLEQSIKARERLLHDVSHELRSPLSRLQLAISLARQAPAGVNTSLDRIEYEGRRLDSVVRELLSLARAESERSPGEDYFDLQRLLESVLADARFEAEAAGIRIVSSVEARASDDDSLNLRGNPELVRWALDNVVRNALRFSTQGQTIHVGLTYDRALRLFKVEVIDEGPGAPDSALPTLFEPFIRADESASGFGLGLAIAKRAVAAQGGTIEASNQPGAGLAVRIALPVTRTPPQSNPSGSLQA